MSLDNLTGADLAAVETAYLKERALDIPDERVLDLPEAPRHHGLRLMAIALLITGIGIGYIWWPELVAWFHATVY